MNQSPLDPRIKAVADKYGLRDGDFWELPQKKGTWIAKHAALEMAAAKAHIIFDAPQIIEANTEAGIAVLSVRGVRYPERVDPDTGKKWYDQGEQSEWSIGEASPKNNKNAYPWAMAEKRAKDRVILKLIGIHGLVYSEDEMADVEQPKAKSRGNYSELQTEVDACQSLDDLAILWKSKPFQSEFVKLPADWQEQLVARKDERKSELTPKAPVPPNFDGFPGDKPL
jgi:hypothetical protein